MSREDYLEFARKCLEGQGGPGDEARELSHALAAIADLGILDEQLPGPDDTVAVAPRRRWKAAALCYDRLVADPPKVPPSVSAVVHMPMYYSFRMMGAVMQRFGPNFPFLRAWGQRILAGYRDALAGPLEDMLGDVANGGISPQEAGAHAAYRATCQELWIHRRIMATPIYADSAQKDREYKAGEKEVIVATLSDLDIVDEDNTPWDAVLQFRGDPDARGKYRRFIHWLDKELVGKPQSFVEDEIAGRLQDYTDALRKHGIRTICGMIRAALDPRHWPACDFAAVAAMLNDKPWWTAGLMIGKVCLSVATALLDHDDVKRGPNREIAYVYEA